MTMPTLSSSHQRITHPLPPFYSHDSKVLILGSFPSVKTRSMGFFYGHPQNRFWKVLGKLWNEEIGPDIDARSAFLKRHHIALWDVIYECDIVGSSDSSIRNVVPTNLEDIIQHSQIEHIYCNGQRAYQSFVKYQSEALNRSAILLPSTSPANAAYSIDDLLEAWAVIRA